MATGREDDGANVVRLRSARKRTEDDTVGDSWRGLIERVIQGSMLKLAHRRDAGALDLESVVFMKTLSDYCHQWYGEAASHELSEVSMFTKPIGIYSFRLLNRRFLTLQHLPNPHGHDGLEAVLSKCTQTVRELAQRLSSATVELMDAPSTDELAATLLDQTAETIAAEGGGVIDETPNDPYWVDSILGEVHSARRSALRNWEERLLEGVESGADSDGEAHALLPHPYVDARLVDGRYLLVALLSPLDVSFVDSRVPASQRAPEATLALYDATNLLYPGAVSAVVPLLRQSFGRLLFMNMLHETRSALTEASKERATIVRHWALMASNGLGGVLSEAQCSAPFDPIVFCDAIVRKVLCARPDGVERTETYPFNRALVFKEAGSSSEISEAPMELLVFEASVLSNNPADRGRYLTAREQRIRGTEDYECDQANKKITDEDVTRLFIHRSPDDHALILSRQRELPDEVKRAIVHEDRRSRDERYAETAGYRIGLPVGDISEDDELSSAVYNLMGRLIPSTHARREIADPANKSKRYTVESFTEDFEKLRLRVLERYDDSGLFFHYENGVDLDTRVPLLAEIQNAYFNYLDDHFRVQDDQFLRDRYRQENMTADQVREIMSSHDALRREQSGRTRLQPSELDAATSLFRQDRSKVVYVSFSWELHDENMLHFLQQSEAHSGGARRALLDKKYTYTLILIADQAPEASVARLVAEECDLRLFMQMLMRQIWVDKLNAYQYLEHRSRSISGCLDQFVHRAKNMVVDQDDLKELDDFHQNLKALVRPTSTPVDFITVGGSGQVFARVLQSGAGPASGDWDEETLRRELARRAAKWCTGHQDRLDKIEIHCRFCGMPRVRVLWSDAVVSDAFTVAMKNAFEAAVLSAQEPWVRVSLQVAPRQLGESISDWHVDLVVENSGGPISEERLSVLNSDEPTFVSKDDKKPASTGAGVFLARYQLRQVVGNGADMMLSNQDGGSVECRIRLPAQLEAENRGRQTQTSAPRTQGLSKHTDYVLYVEDQPVHFEKAVPELTRSCAAHGLALVHRRGVESALDAASQKLPLALLSDMYILRTEADSRPASKKNGLALIEGFMKLASARECTPPIWILTQEEETAVVESIDTGAMGSYHFESAKDDAPRDLTAPGTFCVMTGSKRPDEAADDLLDALLTRVAEQCLLGKDLPDVESDATSAVPNRTIEVALHSDDFEAELSDAAAKLRQDELTVLIAKASRRNLAKGVEDLATWFTHPGMPDPDAYRVSADARYPLHQHARHSRLVLELNLPPSLRRQASPAFLYTMLQHNVWFPVSGFAGEQLASAWLNLRQEDRGPLSVIRHDIKNEWIDAERQPLLTRAIDLLARCEDLLALSTEEKRILMRELRSGNTDAVKEKLETSYFAEGNAARAVMTAISDLWKVFKSAPAAPDLPSTNMSRHLRVFSILHKYLGQT